MSKVFLWVVLAALALIALIYFSAISSKSKITTHMLQLTSTAFANNASIPLAYTCDGQGLFPPIKISDVPADTQSLVLIADDPDATIGNFTHWVVWNIPPQTGEIQEGTEPIGIKGKNSSGSLGYYPPCPSVGEHHYHFRLIALNT